MYTLSGGKYGWLLNIFTQRTVKKCIQWHNREERMNADLHHARIYDWRSVVGRNTIFSRANKKICEINEIYELVIVAQAIFILTLLLLHFVLDFFFCCRS